MRSILLLSVLSCTASAIFFSSSNSAEWNGFRAGFGVNPLSSTTFAALPRTTQEAVEWGWKLDTSGGACGVAGTAFNGNRYRKDGDQAAMVLFDKNGYVAGIQAGIPKTMTKEYPAPQNARHHVFNEEKDMWVVTAYFVEPSTICSTGRTADEFERQGTGYMLAFQTGKTVDSLMKIPHKQEDVTAQTNFVEGHCFYGMGKHYWYDIEPLQMSCDAIFPVFLLYNSNKLNAFGWAFNPNFQNSDRWEHPDRSTFGMFMKKVPDCLGVDGPTTTLHIYLSNLPVTNLC